MQVERKEEEKEFKAPLRENHCWNSNIGLTSTLQAGTFLLQSALKSIFDNLALSHADLKFSFYP